MQTLKLIFFSTGKEPLHFLFTLLLLSLRKQYFSDHVNFVYSLPCNYMVSNWMASQDWKWSTDCLTCRWVFQLYAILVVDEDGSLNSVVCLKSWLSPASSSFCILNNNWC